MVKSLFTKLVMPQWEKVLRDFVLYSICLLWALLSMPMKGVGAWTWSKGIPLNINVVPPRKIKLHGAQSIMDIKNQNFPLPVQEN